MCSDNHANEIWYTPRTAETWQQLLGLYKENYKGPPSGELRWVFRGDRYDADLQTKLEQAYNLYDVPYKDKGECELETVRAFQRKAALYLEHEPDKDDVLEWLAVMRHHGAPVRLMDCTYSFYLAVYMALAENARGVVWVLNAARFNKPQQVKSKIETNGDDRSFREIYSKLESRDDILNLRSKGDKLNDLAITCYLMKHPTPLVYAVNPFRLNKRLTMQQGLFLLAGDPKASFRENLSGCFKDAQDLNRNIHRIAIEVSKVERNNILRELRDMNISNEVLFPGLDGFAKSLAERLAWPEIFPR